MHQPVTPPRTKQAFSLVELSIVLVILGLLIGGILSGQSLIRAAELRSISTDYNRYVTATQTFRDKYFALPGDMSNATSFWGTTASCPGTAGTGTQTCNGNGDGRISIAGAASQYGESFMFWQHLANAGLIEGVYTGIAGSGGGGNGTKANLPTSKFNTALWFPFNWNTSFSGTAQYDGAYFDNLFQLGKADVTGTPALSFISGADAWNIDTKMDDGRPAYGIVRIRFWGGLCTDATNSAALNSNYRLNTTEEGCTLLFTLK